MAASDGRHGADLIEELALRPFRFEIRQAVRLLELAAPVSSKLGEGSEPHREAVRLRGSLASRFPPSEIESLTLGGDERPALTAAYLTLAGAFGPLPPPLASRIAAQARQGAAAARDFLDIFNHRLLSLLMRQERLLHPALQEDLQGAGGARPVVTVLLALLGLATLPPDGAPLSAAARLEGGRRRGVTRSLLAATGLLNQRPVSAHALERLLGGHFGTPARVTPLRGRWLTLAPDQHTRLGRGALTLGRGAALGQKAWDQEAGVRIEMGPTDLTTLSSLLPGGDGHARLRPLVRFALGDATEAELRVQLRSCDATPWPLGRSHPVAAVALSRPQLGWTSWLGRQPREAPAVIRLRIGDNAMEQR